MSELSEETFEAVADPGITKDNFIALAAERGIPTISHATP